MNETNNDLYKYLALNDTIHDFGKGQDRGVDINIIVENILKEDPYKKYTPFGTPTLFSKSPFEKNAETFILDKFDLIGIPGEVLDTEPFFIWEPDNDGTPMLDSTGKPVKIEIYQFTNSNSFDNYALKTDIDTIINLSNINRDKILYTPSEIYPSIDTLSTVLIKDSKNQIKLPQSSLDNKNKFGQFIMKFYFYGDGTNNTIVHNSDATSGNLKCAFAQGFKDNVFGVIRDTTNYADSATTTTTEYGKPCFTGAPPNPFEKDIGVGADIVRGPDGKLILTKTDNPENVYELPSIFPKTNLDSNNEIWIFDNNLFTYDTFIIAFKAKPGDPWIPYKAPYNFSLEIYDVTPNDRESRIQSILTGDVKSIGSANFYPDGTKEKKYSINGPSVPYLKKLIKNIQDPPGSDLKLAFDVKPDTNCIILKGLLTSLDTYLNRKKLDVRKNILIKLLLDIKRCGDYEQVDAIKAIQLQNEGVKNTAGLQDILFTSVDRLCTLYSRFKENNVMWVKGGEKLYTMYRQPYLYPSKKILEEINDKKILAQFKNKVKFINNFLQEIKNYSEKTPVTSKVINNTDAFFQITEPSNQESIQTNIQEIFKNIYEAQNTLLNDGVFIGKSTKLDLLINKFNEIETALQDKSSFKINKGTYIDVKIKISGKFEPNTNFINEYFDILNKNLYGSFNLKEITEKNYDPIDDQIKKSKKETVNMIDQNILSFLKKINSNVDNFNIYYGNLNQIQETFYIDINSSPNSLFTPPPSQVRKSRSGTSGTSGTDTEKLTAYLNLKGLINMVVNIFSINYEIPEVLAQNISYLNEIINQKNLGFGDSPPIPQSVQYIKIVKDLEDVTRLALGTMKTEQTLEESNPRKIIEGATEETTKKEEKLRKKRDRQELKLKKENEKRTKNKKNIENLLLISKQTRTTKGSLLEGLKRKSIRIATNSPRKSPRLSRGGGNLIQTGGGEAESLLGQLFFSMIYDETADIMNQIYSTYLPNELLQMLLLGFDINYDGFEASTPIPLTQEDDVVQDAEENKEEMVEDDEENKEEMKEEMVQGAEDKKEEDVGEMKEEMVQGAEDKKEEDAGEKKRKLKPSADEVQDAKEKKIKLNPSADEEKKEEVVQDDNKRKLISPANEEKKEEVVQDDNKRKRTGGGDEMITNDLTEITTQIESLIPESSEDFSKEEPLILDRETYIKNFFTGVSEYLKMNNGKIYKQFKRDYPDSHVNIDYLYNNIISTTNSEGIEKYLFGDTFIKEDGDNITGIYKLLLDFNEAKVKENEDISNFIKEITCNPEIQDTVDNQLQIMKLEFLNSVTDISNIDVSYYDGVEIGQIVKNKDIINKLFENTQQNPVVEPTIDGEKNAFVCFMNIMSLLLNFDVGEDGYIKYKSDADVGVGVIAYLNSKTNNLNPKKMLEKITFKSSMEPVTSKLNSKQIRVIIFYYFSLLVNLYSDRDIVYFPDEKSINIAMTNIFLGEQGIRTVQNITTEQIGTDFRLINSFEALCNNLNYVECTEVVATAAAPLGGGSRRKTKKNKIMRKQKTKREKNKTRKNKMIRNTIKKR